jgi:hypothetical protein
MADVFDPSQTVWLPGFATMPTAFTVIVKISGVPAQPALSGVTVIVAIPELVVVNDAIFPLPLAASPIDGLSFVQL